MTRVIDPYDELASLFLTSAPSDAPLRPPHAGALKELLIVGHLPVRAGLWLTPYADARARQVGAVALLRVDVPETSLQVLRAPQRIAEAPDPASLQNAIDLVAPSVALWVIRPAADCSAEALLSLDSDRITLLSSADDAAVVNAYQFLKSITDAARRAQRPLPRISLAVVGAEPRSAAITVDRLNRTAAAHLDIDVSLDLCLPRMDAGIRSTRYMAFAAGAAPAAGSALVTQAFTWISEAEKETIHIPQPIPFPIPSAPPQVPQSPPPLRPAAAHQAPAPAASCTAPADRMSEPAAEIPAPPGRKLAPKGVYVQELKDPAQAIEPSTRGAPIGLTGCVEGLVALPFRKPDHERVELAVDARGALHLLTREMNLRDLRIVETWAKKHRELIALACPQMTIDFRAEMAGHLFADDPSQLMDLHGTGIHLHILAKANIGVGEGEEGRGGGWYHGKLSECAQRSATTVRTMI